MISAFGVDHGEFSKRKRDTARGAATGAAIGAGTGAGLAGVSAVRNRHVIRGIGNEMRMMGASKGKARAITATGAAIGGGITAALGGGIGAGAGAAIGRKKRA